MRDFTLPRAALPVLLVLLACAGCGQGANPVSPTAVLPEADAAPPAIPTGLTAMAGQEVVKLAWAANTTDADFLACNVYRLVDGRRHLLNTTPITGNAFIDRDPWQGDCRYAVAALDTAGNQSGLAVVLHVRRPPLPGRDL